MGSAVIVLVRAEWRRQTRALVALALFCGVAAAVVLAGLVGACLLVAISRAIKGRRRADHVG